MDPSVALICSVPLEAEPLLAALDGCEALRVGGKPAWLAVDRGAPLLVVAGGMGKTNAAQALTALLEGGRPVRAVIGFGVAGAYLRAGLALGDVALATAEIYADEGVDAPAGWISTEGIGIPLLERGGVRRFNDFPSDGALLALARAVLGRGSGPVAEGRFLTVSCCSGTREAGDRLAARHQALCETMEGAAYAHVAALYGVPYLGVRAVSNLVEDRDLSRWALPRAASAAAGAALTVARAIATAGLAGGGDSNPDRHPA